MKVCGRFSPGAPVLLGALCALCACSLPPGPIAPDPPPSATIERRLRRLSARELMSAASRLAQIDGNKDGKLTPAELTTRLGIEVSVKRPAAARTDMAAPAIRDRQASAAVPRDRGPAWFLRMDRNYDGDVSIREFLGQRAVFDRLDADHDGLLSPEEAEAAK